MPSGVYTRTEEHIKHILTVGANTRFQKGHSIPQEWREKIRQGRLGKTPWIKGRKHTQEALLKMSLALKGRPLSEQHRQKLIGKHISPSTEFKLGMIPWNKGTHGMQKTLRGEEAPNWQGGITPLSSRIRHSLEFRLWRQKVFERDGYTCQACGIRSIRKYRVNLHPHHIKSFSLYSELRFEINNGITLCSICHSILHKSIAGKVKMDRELRPLTVLFLLSLIRIQEGGIQKNEN